MAKMTRRNVMQKGGLAITAASFGLSKLAQAESAAGGVFHIFAFQWRAEATAEEKERAARDIAAFQGKIPGLIETHVGENLSPRGKGYTFGGVMRFKDQAALDAYVVHSSHQALLQWLVPLIDAIELDLRA